MRKKIGKKFIIIINFIFIFYSICAAERSQSNLEQAVRRPYIWMWGYADANKAQFVTQGIFNWVNIIEGISEDYRFIKQLADNNVLFAYHTALDAAKSEAEIFNDLTFPFRLDTEPDLPGGFKAISIDELAAFKNGSEKSRKMINILKRIKKIYPQKLILVAGGYQLGFTGMFLRFDIPDCSDILNAILDYVDLLGLEFYIRETKLNLSSMQSIPRHLDKKYPGLLDKTIFLTTISQAGYVYNDSSEIRFNGLLEKQFQMIYTDRFAQKMPGIGFWVYYRSHESTILQLEQLVRKYYKTKTSPVWKYIDISSLLSNGSFEKKDSDWVFQGNSEVIKYDSLDGSISNYHGYIKTDMFGDSCLLLTRGHAIDQVIQTMRVMKDYRYYLSFFLRPYDTSKESKEQFITIIVSNPQAKAQQIIKSIPVLLKWETANWQRISMDFKVQADQQVNIVISDVNLNFGNSVLIDFIELDFVEY